MLETDVFTFDPTDVMLIDALGGDDLIAVGAPIDGAITGGLGNDTCVAPLSWDEDCEF